MCVGGEKQRLNTTSGFHRVQQEPNLTGSQPRKPVRTAEFPHFNMTRNKQVNSVKLGQPAPTQLGSNSKGLSRAEDAAPGQSGCPAPTNIPTS